jgi:tripartite ATP-independent transporter DctM subunit
VIVLFASLVVLLVFGVPICYSLAASAILYFLVYQPNLVGILPLRTFAGTDSFAMIALPLFVLMGLLMNQGGITRRIIDFGMIFVGRMRGGLAVVNVIASMIFGGISGSSVSDTASIGAILIPEMTNKGYKKTTATGVTVASSTMGMIIPPSIPMVIFGVASGASIGKLFWAGAIPGLLIGVIMIAIAAILAYRNKWPMERITLSFREFFSRTWRAIPALLMPVAVVGTITFGIATPTEAAGMGVLYAFIIGFFFYRELKLRTIPQLVKQSILISATIMIITTFSRLYTWILVKEHVPGAITTFLSSLHLPNAVVLLMFSALLFFVGDFIDVGPAILLLTPILLPAFQNMGISAIQFGAVLIVGLAVGLATPPVGQCLNVANRIAGLELTDTFVAALPFLVANFVVMILVSVLPFLSEWLPRVLFS